MRFLRAFHHKRTVTVGSMLLAFALLVALTQPAVSQPAVSDAEMIAAGERVGPVKLGMHITDVTPFLGTPKSTQGSSDGSVSYRWYEPKGEGVGLRATRTGEVYRIWVFYDQRYSTKDGIRIGSSETEILASLGEPTRVREKKGNRTLEYDALGIMFVINVDSQYVYYKRVWVIEVYPVRPQ